MNLLTTGGADKAKLVLGVPLYGQSYTLADKKDTSLGSITKGPGDAGNSTAQPGMLSYYEICQRSKCCLTTICVEASNKYLILFCLYYS